MRLNLNVNVHHLARVEGHGNIHIRVEEGQLKEAAWEVVESPRFFEVMLKGKHYTTAGILTARICGICSIGHCLASVRATENTFGVTILPLAAKLRLLAKHGETLQSHLLHLFFLAAPDFLGLTSALPLASARPEIFHLARRFKGVANRLCDAVAGRTTHPVAIQVGGLGMVPQKKVLSALRQELGQLAEELEIVVTLFGSLSVPDFARETEFVALRGERDYPWIGGSLVSTDGVVREESQYQAMTNEYVVPDNTSKWCKLSRQSFAVGALARFNNNSRLLKPQALAAAERLQLKPVCHNPFMNNAAQVVECVHVTLETLEMIDELLDTPFPTELLVPVEPRAGEGVGAVEVPRGILYHHYTYDDEGRVIKANCVIPTTQNNANIHHDLGGLVQHLAQEGMTDQQLELLSSMLVRAYDPCISCSVH
jgi:sulfhydrogenase subunit alpha